MPGVPRATTSRSTSAARRLRLACTWRMARALLELGQRHDDLAVEAARAAAGRGRGCRAGWWPPIITMPSVASKPSISDEHLVERLLPLVVAAAEAGAALAADGVDLVDEDDRPAHLAGRLEQVADPAGADADEHLHEVRAGDRQERHAGLAGDGPGDEGLAGARRADQQHALGDAGADLARSCSGYLRKSTTSRDLLLHARRSRRRRRRSCPAARWSRSWPATGRWT